MYVHFIFIFLFLANEYSRGGLGSVYIGTSATLLVAAETNRVLIFDYGKRNTFIHAIGCENETNEWFFQSARKDTLHFAQQLISHAKLSSWYMGNENLRLHEETVVSITSGEKRQPFGYKLLQKTITQGMPNILIPLSIEYLYRNQIESALSGYEKSKRLMRFWMQLWSAQSLLYSMRLSTKTQAIVEKGIRSSFGDTTKLHETTGKA